MKTTSYTEHLSANRRLTMLRLLESEAEYSLNDSVIQTSLSVYGHSVPREAVRGDMTWLQDQGLVTVEVVTGRTWVCKITTRGLDVALGREVVEGVQRPGP